MQYVVQEAHRIRGFGHLFDELRANLAVAENEAVKFTLLR